MGHALCYECIDDFYLKKIVAEEGSPTECSVCGESQNNAITVEALGQRMEPIMRKHFAPGQPVKKFGDDDSEWWEQEGESMTWAVQLVLGQYFDFEDAIVDAVIDADEAWPPDGEEPYWDSTTNYVETPVRVARYYAEWDHALMELKHSRRFFSPSARSLFETLFSEIEEFKSWGEKTYQPVVRTLPAGTKFYRARVCTSRRILKDIYSDPFKHVGPPPHELARSGRMNAEGVVVFYGATEKETCLAEMRPALKNELALIAVTTTNPLRVLDFTRLEQAYKGKPLSYFQPDFSDQVERRKFLRRLHSLISQPIIPGREADYIITQTMSEYLAHVHDSPLNGILFKSAQRENGVNVVIFAEPSFLTESTAETFHVQYVNESIELFSTEGVEYKHKPLRVLHADDGEPFILSSNMDIDDDWID